MRSDSLAGLTVRGTPKMYATWRRSVDLRESRSREGLDQSQIVSAKRWKAFQRSAARFMYLLEVLRHKRYSVLAEC